jgi:hypothetical protein
METYQPYHEEEQSSIEQQVVDHVEEGVVDLIGDQSALVRSQHGGESNLHN